MWMARDKSGSARADATPLGGGHGISTGIMIGTKFYLDENQQFATADNEINLTQRMAKIPGQHAIALGAQHPARIGFSPAALFEGALSAGDIVRVRTFLFSSFLVIIFALLTPPFAL